MPHNKQNDEDHDKDGHGEPQGLPRCAACSALITKADEKKQRCPACGSAGKGFKPIAPKGK
jgi:rubrerythrin